MKTIILLLITAPFVANAATPVSCSAVNGRRLSIEQANLRSQMLSLDSIVRHDHSVGIDSAALHENVTTLEVDARELGAVAPFGAGIDELTRSKYTIEIMRLPTEWKVSVSAANSISVEEKFYSESQMAALISGTTNKKDRLAAIVTEILKELARSPNQPGVASPSTVKTKIAGVGEVDLHVLEFNYLEDAKPAILVKKNLASLPLSEDFLKASSDLKDFEMFARSLNTGSQIVTAVFGGNFGEIKNFLVISNKAGYLNLLEIETGKYFVTSYENLYSTSQKQLYSRWPKESLKDPKSLNDYFVAASFLSIDLESDLQVVSTLFKELDHGDQLLLRRNGKPSLIYFVLSNHGGSLTVTTANGTAPLKMSSNDFASLVTSGGLSIAPRE